MKLLHRFFARNDRRRSRECLQEFCDERVAARRKLDEATRNADRALKEAKDLEREQFRQSFFSRRDAVRSAYVECNPWVCSMPRSYLKQVSQ